MALRGPLPVFLRAPQAQPVLPELLVLQTYVSCLNLSRNLIFAQAGPFQGDQSFRAEPELAARFASCQFFHKMSPEILELAFALAARTVEAPLKTQRPRHQAVVIARFRRFHFLVQNPPP